MSARLFIDEIMNGKPCKKFCVRFNLIRSVSYICWIEMFYIYIFFITIFSDEDLVDIIDKKTLKKLFLLLGSEQIVKGFTCITLILGTTMNSYKLLQPWIVIEILEIIVGALILATMLIYSAVFRPFIIAIFPLILVIGMKIYYIKCVISLHAMLKSHKKLSIPKESSIEEGRKEEHYIEPISNIQNQLQRIRNI